MDLRKIKTLIELVENSGISELEVREGEAAVRISRASAAPQVVMAAPPAAALREAVLPAQRQDTIRRVPARGPGAGAPPPAMAKQTRDQLVDGDRLAAPEPELGRRPAGGDS